MIPFGRLVGTSTTDVVVPREHRQRFETASHVGVDRQLLDETDETRVIVGLDDRPKSLAQSTDEDEYADRLKQHANGTQDSIVTVAKESPHMELEDRFWITNSVLVTVNTSAIPVEQLALVENVEQVYRDYEIEVTRSRQTTPGPANQTDEEVRPSSGSSFISSLELLNVSEAWDGRDRGTNASVAVLDTGVDNTHEAFTDFDNTSRWGDFSADGNGASDTNIRDGGFHGTHVSGTVFGGDESGEHIGVAPDAEMWHGKVFNDDGSGQLSYTRAGIQWAVNNDVDVISMSLGSVNQVFLEDDLNAIRNAHQSGSLSVVATGNNGKDWVTSPANVYESVAVGSTGNGELSSDEDQVSSFSNYQEISHSDWPGSVSVPSDWPDPYYAPNVVAPGEGIKSADAGTTSGYRDLQGTSMATPHVSGTAALMISNADGELSPDDITYVLEETAVDIGGGTKSGDGRVDAAAAVDGVTSEFDVTIDDVNSSVTAGDQVVVEYTVENTALVDAVDDTQDVTLSINGTDETTNTDLTLAGTETFSGEFTYSTDGSDVSEITVEVVTADDSATATVEVSSTSDPFFDSTIDSVDDSVQAGEDIVVEYTIDNTGGAQDTQDVELLVNETVEATNAAVTLSDGQQTTGSFTYTTDSNDVSEITVEVATANDTATSTVRVDPKADPFFDVTIDNTPGPVTATDDIAVDYTVNNTGDKQATQDIRLLVDGTERERDEGVTLDGGEETTGSFIYTTATADTPNIDVTVESDDDTASKTASVNEQPEEFAVAIDEPADPVAGYYGDPGSVTVHVVLEDNGDPIETTLDGSDVDIEVGGTSVPDGDIMLTDRIADVAGAYRIDFVAPNQGAVGSYDLDVEVTDGGETDDATRLEAIEYDDESRGKRVSVTAILDVSDSMGSGPGSHLRNAKEGFNTLANNLGGDDEFGLVAYADEARVEQKQRRVSGNASQISTGIFGASNDGIGSWTNIGDGLIEARDQLNGSSNDERAAIILTDGDPNIGPGEDEILDDIAESYDDEGYDIYTVAYRDAADAELMREIANVTDESGNVSNGPDQRFYSNPGPNQLRNILFGIAEDTSILEVQHTDKGTVDATDSSTNELPVDETIQSGTLTLRFDTKTTSGTETAATTPIPTLDSGSAPTASKTVLTDGIDVQLTDPDGNDVALDEDTPTGTNRSNVEYVEGDTTAMFRLDDPTAGKWAYEIESTHSEPIEYRTSLSAETTTTATAATDADVYTTGSVVELTAAANEEFENESVVATIQTPSGGTETTALASEDGTYVGTYEVTDPGNYTATITIDGERTTETTDTNWTVVDAETVVDVRGDTEALAAPAGTTATTNLTIARPDQPTAESATTVIAGSALAGPDGTTIDADAVNITSETFSLAPGASEPVSLAVTSPAGVTPGTYTGTLTVSVDGIVHKRSLELDVVDELGAPLELPDTRVIANETASFTVEPTVEEIETYEWSFGDNTTATTRSPTHVYDEPGIYTVSVTVTDTWNRTVTTTKELTILAPGSLTITSVEQTESIDVNETLTVPTTVQNTGDTQIESDVRLTVDNETVDTQPVSLNAGEATSTSLLWSPAEPDAGTHTVSVIGTDEHSFELTVNVTDGNKSAIGLPPANSNEEEPSQNETALEVRPERPSATEVTTGERVVVDVAIKNVGAVAGSTEVTLHAGDRAVDTATVHVEPGKTTMIALRAGFDRPGDVALSVNGESIGSITVIEEDTKSHRKSADEAQTDGQDSSRKSDGTAESIPGFNLFSAVNALIISVLLLARFRSNGAGYSEILNRRR